MKTILVPTDFSKPALWASEVATSIAKKADATLVLLHVVEQPTEGSFNVEGQTAMSDDMEERLYTLKLIEKAKEQLAEVAAKVESDGAKVKTELRMGNPFHGMRSIITDHKVDLVVMGTSGKSKFEEVLIGSNTEKVVRYSRCSVLTVHQKPKDVNFKNIVYATSLSEREKLFARVVTKAQEMYDSTIHLVRINTPSVFQPDHTVKKAMGVFASGLRLKNYTINTFSDYNEEEGIINFANSVNADMIAMATHGRTGIGHILAGSIAEDIVNHASKPVLTFVTKDF
jgi:nucleotide-binding universal stress UspA family protein